MIQEIPGLDVSRETLERLETYVSLLSKWNPKINLVSPATLEDAWTRHFVDSAQLFRLIRPSDKSWVDMGSGGGFPGMVIAILSAGAEQGSTAPKVTLMESDQRKAAFLRTVARETGVAATILSQRIESAPEQAADIVSARALAPLPKLLDYVARHRAPKGRALLPKGHSWQKEVDKAQALWTFDLTTHMSDTDPDATVLEIGALSHV